MNLLDAARWMAHNRPHEIGEACWYCNAGQPDDSYLERPPKPDCPWLALPKIVAALEVAERVAAAYERRQARLTGEGLSPAASLGSFGPTLNEVERLVAALRGDPS